MQLDQSQSAVENREYCTMGTRKVGVVAIGRNEGERLRTCLQSVRGLAKSVVYVDSGSTDGSVEVARSLTSSVVELDMGIPFTAARARNQGFQRLMEIMPESEYVFFVDGDCEVVSDWLQKAVAFLEEHGDIAVVWGMRRERYPEKSIYNMLCNIEWEDYSLGETKSCGGDALIRVDALKQVNGYRPDLICGEEPEMCVRLRQAGWRVWHLDEPMTIHDAAIYHFRQWWKRMLRGGYAFAQAWALHGEPPELHGVLESRRAWVWGFLLPVLCVALCFAVGAWGLLVLLIYPIQITRLAVQGDRPAWQNRWRAAALVVSKFPEVLGQMKYLLDRYRRVQSRLIEYK
jgi:GT2 family glycosyltransferase